VIHLVPIPKFPSIPKIATPEIHPLSIQNFPLITPRFRFRISSSYPKLRLPKFTGSDSEFPLHTPNCDSQNSPSFDSEFPLPTPNCDSRNSPDSEFLPNYPTVSIPNFPFKPQVSTLDIHPVPIPNFPLITPRFRLGNGQSSNVDHSCQQTARNVCTWHSNQGH
jgi:hypothetical protein